MALLVAEVIRAGERFGPQSGYADAEWLAVLVEEVGEAAEIINDRRLGKLAPELAAASLAEEVAQIGAVAVRWMAAMGRRG